MINYRKNMIALGGLLLLLAVGGLWFFLAYQSEKSNSVNKGEWVCEGKQWVRKGETDEKRPPVPCPDNKPSVKGPTAPPPQ